MSIIELAGYIQFGEVGSSMLTVRTRVVTCERAKSGWAVIDAVGRRAISVGMKDGQVYEFVRLDGKRHRITVEWGDHRPASAPRDSTLS